MKETRRVNFRVEVVPDLFSWQSERSQQASCKRIVEQIKRHVDDIHHAVVEFDSEVTCSHCGYSWEEDANEEPMCCDKAQEEWGEGLG